jgi:Phage tail sheath protein subtilisin-like domain
VSELALKAPGLYLRSLESEPPLAPQTAVTAFVGVAERGPLHAPQPVRNWGEYVDVFGEPWGRGFMADSLYAFFLNGGEKAHAVRVGRMLPEAPGAACRTQEPLAIAGNSAAIVDHNGLPTLTLKAKNEGSWGNRLRALVRADGSAEMEVARLTASAPSGAAAIEVDFVYDLRPGATLRLTHRDNPFAKSTHQVTAIVEATRRVTVTPLLGRAYPAGSAVSSRGFALEVTDGRRLEVFDNLSMRSAHPRYFADVVNGTARDAYVDAARKGHSLLVRTDPASGQPRFKPLPLSPIGFSGGGDGTTFAQGALLDGAEPALLATSLLKGRDGNFVRLRAEAFGSSLSLAVPSAPGGLKDRLVLRDVRGFLAGETVTITHATTPAINETATVLSVSPDEHLLNLTASLAGDYPLESRVGVADRFSLFVERPGDPHIREPFFNLSLAAGPRFFKDIVNGVADPSVSSKLVCVDTADPPSGLPTGEVQLSGGTDPGEMPLPYYTGYLEDGSPFLPSGPDIAIGLATLEAVVDVNLVALPDLAGLTDVTAPDLLLAHRQVLFHCQKLGERFALLDPPPGLSLADALAWPAQVAEGRLTRYGAFYYPWIEAAIQGQKRFLPPSGVIAGLIAQADRREGVGRAPANFNLKGVVAPERDVDAAEQGELNLRGVNCIRKFENGAIRLWGARSLSPEPEHLYVSSRRVVLAVIKALSRNLLWAVFEPNDSRLRRRIKDSLEGFFQALLARGLTAGGRPAEAYYVKVDESLNGPEVRETGQLLAEIGIAVTRPAEFIVLAVKRRPEIVTLVEEET